MKKQDFRSSYTRCKRDKLVTPVWNGAIGICNDCRVEQRVVIVAMRLNHLGGWVGQCGCCGHFALKHPHTTHQEFETGTHPTRHCGGGLGGVV